MITTPTDPSKDEMTLGDLGEFRNGVNFAKGLMGQGLGLINVKDIFRDSPTIDFDSLDLVNLVDAKGIDKYFVEEGDIFFVRSSVKRDGIGFVTRANRKNHTAVHCGFVIRFRPDRSKVDSQFLTYALRSPHSREKIRNLSGGAAITNISQEALRTLAVPIPNLVTQRRIAGILSAYDDLIENCQRRIQILEEMARSLYREWFVNFRYPGHESEPLVPSPMGEIPKGWEVKPFTDIADVMSGGTPKTDIAEYWNGEIPFFTPRDAPSCFYVQDTEKHVTTLGLSKCASEHYPPDTVFITARGTVGKVALPAVPMAMNQSCYALRGKAGIPQRFLFLMTLQQVNYLKTNTGGATFDTIVVDTFRRMEIVKPTREVLTNFAKKSDAIFEQVNTIQRQAQNLRQTRDLLLPRLMSGQLEVAVE